MANPLTYNGVTYPSLSAFARHHNLNPSRLAYYISRGNTISEAIKKHNTEEFVEVFGKKFPSLAHVAKHYNMFRPTLAYRLKMGDTLEQAITKGNIDRTIIVFGKQHDNIKHLAEHYNLDIATLRTRTKKGEPLEEAVKYLLSKEPIKFEGKEYPSMNRLCEAYLIDSTLVMSRLNNGWALNDAITTPLVHNYTRPKYLINEVYYSSKREACEAHGLTLGFILEAEQSYNLGFEKTLLLLHNFLSNYRGNRPQLIGRLPYVIYNETWYLTQKDFAKEVGLSPVELTKFMTYHGVYSVIEATQMIKTKTRDRWYDMETNEQVSRKLIINKYQLREEAILARGLAVKKSVLAYPTCTFNPTGYCATPAKDFKEHLIKAGVRK